MSKKLEDIDLENIEEVAGGCHCGKGFPGFPGGFDWGGWINKMNLLARYNQMNGGLGRVMMGAPRSNGGGFNINAFFSLFRR